MTLQLKSTQDGHGYEVCVTEDEITECTFVSSMHLVDKKEKQLRSRIKRQAFNSFIERKAEDR
tara:strand:- start:387 stop:575 length:189 start_codon:yes stop_codon:yes gene_type:complete